MTNAEKLYDETTVRDIECWLEACEGVDTERLTPWEQSFVGSLREQFDEKTDAGSEKPLTGAQLLKLRQIYDKVM